MKIEKISENQIKFFLDENDLKKDKYIKLKELTSEKSSEQKQALELLSQLVSEISEEYNFEIDTSFMIETVPVNKDSIVIIVSKVNDSNDCGQPFSMVPQSKLTRKFKRKDVLISDSETKEEFNTILIYSFNTFNDIETVSKTIDNSLVKNSIVCKNDGLYYLILELESENKNICEQLSIMISEYGQKYISNELSKQYFLEHGETIIKSNAIDIIKQYL